MALRLLNISRRLLKTSSFCGSLAREEKIGETITAKRARLLYQSKKRGILENDILLGDFADVNLPTMTASELEAYDKLINGEHMEWDLFYYMSDKKPAPSEIANCKVYKMLKSFVTSKKAPRH
ncbi:unnamed protein product [Caenorhabditis bovis]|uniref:Succinate dehydrogenase assembly factor 2, mitochondrial n=1 Tax=Caenorhabditis bovis TaxID=2654633 RepID=A0A8S1EZU2_9PELO|nr:unnamed protein product [Caenorhabditis bovis]